jgi:fatty acid omega-hydroxylase
MTYIREFGKQIIRDRRVYNANGKPPNDLIQLFFDSKEDFSDDELADQVINFIIAGRDTTSQTLSWALYCLDKNPHVVKKLIEESNGIMGDSKIPTYDQVRALKYANCVFMETLRLYPPVSRNAKVATQDDVLPNGVEIRKGNMIIFSPYSLGRSKNVWEDPYEFKPERFMDSKEPSAFKFLAFNAGPRTCLGKTMAELQGVFVLISLLRSYEFKVIDPTSVVSPRSLSLPMKNGLMCKISKRE